ncbi:hypothetical protein JCM3774_000253 [Rhodotorula dairenensis]
MNTLAAFTASPLGALHFAHPASSSVLLQAMSASSSSSSPTSTSGSDFFGGAGSERASSSSPSSSKLLPRLGFKKRVTRASDGNDAEVRPTCIDISAPVLISSSNPIACPVYSSRGPSYLLVDLNIAQAASKTKKKHEEEEDKSELDVPYSPTSPTSIGWASRPGSMLTAVSPPSYASERDQSRPLVRVEEVERRLSEYDEERRIGTADEVAHKDGRLAEELKKLGL